MIFSNWRKRGTQQKGMSLLEVMIAMIILSSGIVLLANAWGGAFMRVRKTDLTHEVALLLERKITEIKLEYKNRPLGDLPDEISDDFGSEYPQYSWRMASRDFEMPDLSGALVAREGGANEVLLQVIQTMTEHISNSVKEVTVTVIFAPGGGTPPLEYDVTTYFVDHSKGLPGAANMSGGASL